jgi:Divergent InlB B-repeat domain
MRRSNSLLILSLLAFPACESSTVPLGIDVAGIANGGGTVVVTGNGKTILTCHDHCTTEVAHGASIVITATPDEGSRFLDYSPPCGLDAACTVMWTVPGRVTATFRPSGNFAFVSSKTVSMPLGNSAAASQAAADAFCQTQAGLAKLPGDYVAWLSTSDRTAVSKLEGSRGWIRPDGRPLADTPAHLAHGEIYHPLELDENGLLPNFDPAVPFTKWVGVYFTGTHVDGVASTDNCSDYTANTGAITVGDGANGPIWTDFPFGGSNIPDCSVPLSLACFEVGASVDVTPHDSGRLAFVTDGNITPSTDGGRAAADQLCATEASHAGLPGEYLALMATSSKTDGAPLSRFDTSAGALPWVRLDGVGLVEHPMDMGGRTLLAPVGVTPTLQYVDDYFWAGSDDPLTRATAADQNCADWTDAGGKTESGSSDRSDLWFHEGLGDLCQFPHRVLCLQK